ncbi:ArnT family glycosyltransferase [Mesorhizobium sp.]|uniref:ArnT family glycosyltransferase n=1 Tax=Mesorhizobium sp. TaxID=1871066 RepID=UPI003BA99A74
MILLVGAFLVLRIALAAVIPLSIDEAYAVVVSRSHSLSYFDHPPLGFALGRLMADITGCECRLFVRLPYVLLGSLSALLLFDLSRQAYGAVAAFWAVAWYTVAPFFLISAGHFVVPDGPLNFFLLASAWAVAPMLLGKAPPHALLRWSVAGVALGLALMSKYQAGLFCVSALLILVSTKPGRAELATPGPWVAGVIALLGLLPVVLWNMNHEWVSFAFQSGRGLATEGHLLHPGNLAITLVGQAAYVWPVVWIVAIVCIWKGVSTGSSVADRFFALIAVLPVVFFDMAALFSAHSLPHWSMSGFLFAFPLVGQWCGRFAERKPGLLRVSFATAAIVVPLLAVGFALQTTTGAFTRPFHERATKFDINWQLVDWSELTNDTESSDLSGADAYVVAADWMQGARIAHALGPNVPIEVLPGDPRHFQFMDDKRLDVRGKGFFVGALNFGKEAEREQEYRNSLGKLFVVDGPARHVTQSVAGFPIFEILILPIRRANPLQPTIQDSAASPDSRPLP